MPAPISSRSRWNRSGPLSGILSSRPPKGVLGLYWNPAALAYTEGTEVLFSRMNWIGDTHLSFVGVAQDIGPGAIGLSVTALTMDDMEITTELQPNGTGEQFGSGSYAVGLSFGLKIIDRFSFGGTVKYIHEYIWETSGSTYAFDLGSVYTTDFHQSADRDAHRQFRKGNDLHRGPDRQQTAGGCAIRDLLSLRSAP